MSVRSVLHTAIVVLVHVVSLPSQAAAQPDSAAAQEQPTEQAQDSAPKSRPSLPSAHATLRAFFDASKAQDWAGAAECLDFSQLPSDLSQSARRP